MADPAGSPDTESNQADDRPPLVADRADLVELTEGVWVLPDLWRTPHVPNVGFVVGTHSVLVVESGMGIENGRRVLEIARDLADGRRLLLTASHFHPEHGLGAQPFLGTATILMNEAQRGELFEKGQDFIDLFRTFSPGIEEALRGVELVDPDVVYRGNMTVDLGGRVAELSERGDGHTRGDQWILLPAEGVVFAGDLVEERFHAIMPDQDSSGEVWLARLREIEALEPRVVVPGHGAIGGTELTAAARRALEEIRDLAFRLRDEGLDADEVALRVEAEIVGRYEDWGNCEWVGPSARNFLGR